MAIYIVLGILLVATIVLYVWFVRAGKRRFDVESQIPFRDEEDSKVKEKSYES